MQYRHMHTARETFNTCTLLHTVQQSLADERASDLSRLTAQSLWEFHLKLYIEVALHLGVSVHRHPVVCHPSDHTYVCTYIRTHPSPPLARRAMNKASMMYICKSLHTTLNLNKSLQQSTVPSVSPLPYIKGTCSVHS